MGHLKIALLTSIYYFKIAFNFSIYSKVSWGFITVGYFACLSIAKVIKIYIPIRKVFKIHMCFNFIRNIVLL